MDFCSNTSLPRVSPVKHLPEHVLASPSGGEGDNGIFTEVFPHHSAEADVGLEWLSTFVEDCLSSAGNCLPLPTTHQNLTITNNKTSKNLTVGKANPKPNPLKILNSSFPQSTKIKRRRARRVTGLRPQKNGSPFNGGSKLFTHLRSLDSDPPLLQQAYWLADSELILPKKEEKSCGSERNDEEMVEEIGKEGDSCGGSGGSSGGGQQGRRCSHCQAQKTPQWRAGPLGPKTLCNACGVRWLKSGKLFPEYRPAKSPTFMSYMHSNFHKKVLEMRMALLSPTRDGQR